jgi:hypothetical protein
VSVGVDELVRLWDPRAPKQCVDAMRGHNGSITGVVAEGGGSVRVSDVRVISGDISNFQVMVIVMVLSVRVLIVILTVFVC